MPSDWPDPVEIGDSSASHAALSWPALRFALVNAEGRFLWRAAGPHDRHLADGTFRWGTGHGPRA